MANQQPWLPDWKVRAAYGAAGIQPGPYDRQITLTNTTLGSGVSLALPSTSNNNAQLLPPTMSWRQEQMRLLTPSPANGCTDWY